ncbi:MAG: helix-turn-helix transcriptional regulator [Bacteroidetes bacterium]|jgi:putative transcriptional regulator|nr:helix-turn-helix transcriptional regulator [Bacteroidota bacterium]
MKNNIRVERAILRISQQELADKIGVTRQTVNAIELEKFVPSAVITMKMSAIFGKPVNDFFYLEESDWGNAVRE